MAGSDPVSVLCIYRVKAGKEDEFRPLIERHWSTLDSGTWYRVTVGPFTTQVAEQRALTRLRENNLAAYRIKKG